MKNILYIVLVKLFKKNSLERWPQIIIVCAYLYPGSCHHEVFQLFNRKVDAVDHGIYVLIGRAPIACTGSMAPNEKGKSFGIFSILPKAYINTKLEPGNSKLFIFTVTRLTEITWARQSQLKFVHLLFVAPPHTKTPSTHLTKWAVQSN